MTDTHYLERWPGLYVRRDGAIVEASEEDVAAARRYPDFPDKGGLADGCRVTIISRKQSYRVGEEIRIIHIVDFPEPGHLACVTGPKPVYDEYVDDVLATEASRPGEALVPLEYNGKTLPTPAVDYNYEITSYRFTEPGTYRVQWRPGSLRSNLLALEVSGPPA